MALTIKRRIGAETEATYDSKTVLNVIADLYDGVKLIATRNIQGVITEAEYTERAQAAFAGFREGDPPEAAPPKPTTTGWKTEITKTAQMVEP